MAGDQAFDYGFLLHISEDGPRAEALNEYLSSRSYLAGYGPSKADAEAFALFRGRLPPSQHVHALRWYRHIASLQPRTDGQASDATKGKRVQPPWSPPSGTEFPKLRLYNSLTRTKSTFEELIQYDLIPSLDGLHLNKIKKVVGVVTSRWFCSRQHNFSDFLTFDKSTNSPGDPKNPPVSL